MARITVADLSARMDKSDATLEALAGTLATLVKVVSGMSVQFATPAPVAEATVTPISTARTAKKSASKKAGATKTTTGTSAKAVTVIEIDAARALVEAGENPWHLHVVSSEGNTVPFGVILRAEKAAARAVAPKAAAKPAKASTAVKAVGTKASAYFAMTGAQLVADGSKGAQAEIARRAAKRASK